LLPTLSAPVPSEHPLPQSQPTLAVIHPIAQDFLLVSKEVSAPGTAGDTLYCLCIGLHCRVSPGRELPVRGLLLKPEQVLSSQILLRPGVSRFLRAWQWGEVFPKVGYPLPFVTSHPGREE
jgi:hypothetical protein